MRVIVRGASEGWYGPVAGCGAIAQPANVATAASTTPDQRPGPPGAGGRPSGATELAEGFIEDDGDGGGKIEAPHVYALHGNAVEPLRMLLPQRVR